MGVFSVNLFKYFTSLTFHLMPLSYLRNCWTDNNNWYGSRNKYLFLSSFLSVYNPCFTQGPALTWLWPVVVLLLTSASYDPVRHSGLPKSLYGVRHSNFLREFWLKTWESWVYWQALDPMPCPAQLTIPINGIVPSYVGSVLSLSCRPCDFPRS